jgi:hypothetical protein
MIDYPGPPARTEDGLDEYDPEPEEAASGAAGSNRERTHEIR